MGIKNVWFYGIVGLGGVWVAFLMSGIHATISAVLAAMMIPADSQIAEPALAARLRKQLKRFEQTDGNNVVTLEPEQVKILSRMRTDSENAIPPSQRLEHGLQPFVAFVIIPVFALANAGVSFLNMDGSILFSNHVALGVMFGLLVGKPLGIVLAVWLTEKLGLGKRSRNMTWQRIIGIGFLASIGFTMSMFITMLAFNDPTQHIQAKVGIFAASILGGVMGYAILKKN
jgi:Na+:H+ antiporter, NhaA family